MNRDLAEQLEEQLATRDMETVRLAALEAQSLGLAIYMVGGFPRDLLLGRTPTDFDLVVDGDAIALARALAARHGGTITIHAKFGTAKWRPGTPGESTAAGPTLAERQDLTAELDLISARSETYPRPAQLPQVRRGTIEEDLRRRDFTINALAIRLDGTTFGALLDPLGAVRDMERRVIRVLHDQSFRDDPTRLYRAARYEKRLDFAITPGTLKLIAEARMWVAQLSAQRLRQELEQSLAEENAGAIVLRLGRLGLLRAAHPALPYDSGTVQRLDDAGHTDDGRGRTANTRGARRWLLWLMPLSPAQIRSVRKRLHFDKRLTSEMLAASTLRRNASGLAGLRPSKLTQQLERLPLRAVEAVYAALPEGRPRHRLGQYLTEWRHLRPRTSGHVLKEMGIPPGPSYRFILQDLRDQLIDGTIGSAADEKLQLEKLLARLKGRSSRKITRSPKRHIP